VTASAHSGNAAIRSLHREDANLAQQGTGVCPLYTRIRREARRRTDVLLEGCRSATPSPSICVVSRATSATLATGQGWRSRARLGGRAGGRRCTIQGASPPRRPGASTWPARIAARSTLKTAFRYRIVPGLEVFFMEIEGDVSDEEMHVHRGAARRSPLSPGARGSHRRAPDHQPAGFRRSARVRAAGARWRGKPSDAACGARRLRRRARLGAYARGVFR